MGRRLKIMFVLGTRPEGIKLCPVVLRARERGDEFETVVCSTGQHREMLDQVLSMFGVQPDVKLNVMAPNQDLFDLTGTLIRALGPVFRGHRCDWVFVQGDTTTVWTAALGAFYENVKVGHVEAGLRSFDKRQPFPEEINRRLCSQLADLHFAPTAGASDNLRAEGVPAGRIRVTGNTVIDALLWMVRRLDSDPPRDARAIAEWARHNLGEGPVVLVTGHRRESFGEGFRNICLAIRELATRFPAVHWVYPVHLNPNVQGPVRESLADRTNIHLLDPLPYSAFCWLLRRCSLVLTDSGGVQEEAPSLGKLVMVTRNTTERPEGLAAGCSVLVGNSTETIVVEVAKHLSGRLPSTSLGTANPYGDGRSSDRILDAVLADG